MTLAEDAAARQAELPEIGADGVGRFAPEVEAAVYFCALETLQNAVKHAEAGRIRIDLEARDGRLGFRVADDGAGFERGSVVLGMGLQGMVDRISALGGDLTISSAPGTGTIAEGGAGRLSSRGDLQAGGAAARFSRRRWPQLRTGPGPGARRRTRPGRTGTRT